MIDRIIDTSILSPFARARKLDTLERLTAGSRRLITRSVKEEIEKGAGHYPVSGIYESFFDSLVPRYAACIMQ